MELSVIKQPENSGPEELQKKLRVVMMEVDVVLARTCSSVGVWRLSLEVGEDHGQVGEIF